jgi:hypothetical protein
MAGTQWWEVTQRYSKSNARATGTRTCRHHIREIRVPAARAPNARAGAYWGGGGGLTGDQWSINQGPFRYP